MKKLIVILLASSLALAAAVNAAQEDPKTKKAAPKTNAAPKLQAGPKQHIAPTTHVQSVHTKNTTKLNNTKINQTNVNQTNLNQSQTRRYHSNFSPNKVAPPKSQNASGNVNNSVKSVKQPTANMQSEQLPAVQNNPPSNPNLAVVPKTKAVPNIQNIQARYKNFRAKPNPAVASAQFNQNYQIQGAQNWSGPQYQVFASYRPQWHDQGWWQNRYSSNLLLIGGGWYYWDSGYWYPAWGYDSSAAYYPYDGPIYTGETRRPFDEVVADVQASLQEQGYYKGEVDGLMGPLTREALASFQRDHGLITTAALDQPTLASLGLG